MKEVDLFKPRTNGKKERERENSRARKRNEKKKRVTQLGLLFFMLGCV